MRTLVCLALLASLAGPAARADYIVSASSISSIEYSPDNTRPAGNQIGFGYGWIQPHTFVATATFDLGLDTSRISGITLFGTIDGFHDALGTYYYTDFSLFSGFAEFTGTGIMIATFRADNGGEPSESEFMEFGPPTGPDFSTDVSASDVTKILSAVQSSGGVLSLDMTGNVYSRDGRGGVGYLENVGLIVHEIPAAVPEPSGLWLLGSGGLVVSLMATWNRFPRRHGDDLFRSR